MFKEKQVLELFYQGLSQRSIELNLSCSRHTISKFLKLAVEKNLTPEKLQKMDEQDVHYFLFPEKLNTFKYEVPDFEYIHKETKRVGVTVKLLWEEYVAACTAQGKLYYKYSRYCEMYQKYVNSHRYTQHLIHKPGNKVQVDWDGKTMAYLNPKTGRMKKAYLFVGSLPFSDYTYVEATDSMKEEDWINCHIHMYEFFGGITNLLVCDNCRTAIVKNGKYEDPVLNPTYRELADHYYTAILPTRVSSPQDKGLVERQVHEVTINIIGRLRNEKFVSLVDLNFAIRLALEKYNKKPFQEKDGSRYSVFMDEEKAFLKALPRIPYEYATWKKAKVQIFYHVAIDHNYYSVPYKYVGEYVNVKVTKQNITIYHEQKCIARHYRLYGKSQYSTIPDHMPNSHRIYQDWNKKRFFDWASKVGPNAYKVIFNLFESYKVEEQGYKSAICILKLADKYTNERLEKACALALKTMDSPRYKQLNMILISKSDLYVNTQDIIDAKPESVLDTEKFAFIRGGKYYDEQ